MLLVDGLGGRGKGLERTPLGSFVRPYLSPLATYFSPKTLELVKGSLLRRSGSFGGRSKITQTLTSGALIAQSTCRSAA